MLVLSREELGSTAEKEGRCCIEVSEGRFFLIRALTPPGESDMDLQVTDPDLRHFLAQLPPRTVC